CHDGLRAGEVFLNDERQPHAFGSLHQSVARHAVSVDMQRLEGLTRLGGWFKRLCRSGQPAWGCTAPEVTPFYGAASHAADCAAFIAAYPEPLTGQSRTVDGATSIAGQCAGRVLRIDG